jgi:hypothetical protein
MLMNMDAWTLIIAVALAILIALFLWNYGILFLKAAFIIGCALGAIHFWQTELIGLVLLAIGVIAFLVLVIEPAHKKGQ